MKESVNFLLERLSENACEQMMKVATWVSLPAQFPLYLANQTPEYAYLLCEGFAYVMMPINDQEAAPVAPLGRASITGLAHLLGPAPVPNSAYMQIVGRALRVQMGDLLRLFQTDEEIHHRLLELVQAEYLVAQQIAACHLTHEADTRLASRLLLAQENTPEDIIGLTQQNMANIVGARRTTITMLAGEMQKAGIITYGRGKVKLRNPVALRKIACTCHTVVRDLWNGLYTKPLQTFRF